MQTLHTSQTLKPRFIQIPPQNNYNKLSRMSSGPKLSERHSSTTQTILSVLLLSDWPVQELHRDFRTSTGNVTALTCLKASAEVLSLCLICGEQKKARGSRNIDQHAAFQAMWLQYDHLLPHARGGDNSLDNVVITCAPCNFGRMNWTLDEVGLIDPRTRQHVRSVWTGLEQFR